MDGNKNILIVETREGEQVSYNPAQLRRQAPRAPSTAKRPASWPRETVFSFTAADRENRVRSGDVATVDGSGTTTFISARLDSGRGVELDRRRPAHRILLGLAMVTHSRLSLRARLDRVRPNGLSTHCDSPGLTEHSPEISRNLICRSSTYHFSNLLRSVSPGRHPPEARQVFPCV